MRERMAIAAETLRWWAAGWLQSAWIPAWTRIWKLGLWLTEGAAEHPEEFDAGCLCDECLSYGE